MDKDWNEDLEEEQQSTQQWLSILNPSKPHNPVFGLVHVMLASTALHSTDPYTHSAYNVIAATLRSTIVSRECGTARRSVEGEKCNFKEVKEERFQLFHFLGN